MPFPLLDWKLVIFLPSSRLIMKMVDSTENATYRSQAVTLYIRNGDWYISCSPPS